MNLIWTTDIKGNMEGDVAVWRHWELCIRKSSSTEIHWNFTGLLLWEDKTCQFTMKSSPIEINWNFTGSNHALQWRHNERNLKSPAPRLFTQLFVQVQIKEYIKVPRHWPLCAEFTGDRWIPHTKGQEHGKCFHLVTSSWRVITLRRIW